MNYFLISILVMILGLCASACGPSHSPPGESETTTDEPGHANEVYVDPEVAVQQGIRVERAATRLLAPVVTVPARVTLSQDGLARVASPIEGRVLELFVQTGDEVAAGDPLAELESPAYAAAQREFMTAVAASSAAAAPVELARDAWRRASELHAASGDPALAEVQRRELELRRAETEGSAAEARAALARDRLGVLGMSGEEMEALRASGTPSSRFLLLAPIPGRVIERATAIGQFYGPEDEALLTIADFDRLWVIANFPESRLRDLRIGAPARVLLESEPNHGCPGKISFVSPVLDLATRTVEVRILPEDHHEELRPGMFARAEIEIAVDGAAAAPGVAVPEDAVVRLDGESAVFVPVPGETGVYAPRVVRIGRAVRGWVPVYEGLAEGEAYVAAGGFLLKAELEQDAAGHDH